MKQLKTLILLAALGISGASAQTITVVSNDGTSYKFNADYVKELRFAETEASMDFSTLSVEPFANGNVALTLTSADSSTELVLDTYGENTDNYLVAHNYEVKAEGAYRIDMGKWSYAKINGDQKSLKSGSMEVSYEGKVVTLKIDITTADDIQIVGSYTGDLNKYGPIVAINPTAAKFSDNAKEKGEFYVNFNDTMYTFEMAVDFFADQDATSLPDGTYTYSAVNNPGTFSSKTYVDMYSPYTNNKMKGGTVTVSTEGSERVIKFDLQFEDGRLGQGQFKGKISGTPIFN